RSRVSSEEMKSRHELHELSRMSEGGWPSPLTPLPSDGRGEPVPPAQVLWRPLSPALSPCDGERGSAGWEISTCMVARRPGRPSERGTREVESSGLRVESGGVVMDWRVWECR